MKLVQFGADVTVRDLQKETPLHLGLDPGLTTRKFFVFFYPFSTTKKGCSLKTEKTRYFEFQGLGQGALHMTLHILYWMQSA